MNADVTPQQITRNSNLVPPNDSRYWDERRRWWVAEARRQGVDWPGIQESLREAADYLAHLREAGVVVNSPEAIVAEQPEPKSEVRGEYDTLSGLFAEACREADAGRRPVRRPGGDSLRTSTRITIDWLLKHCDEQRLEKFIEGRPAAEIARIHDYIGMKLNGSHS
jgi:hypothetical protein